MKISIIIPVYNAEKYLRRCLDSIVNQTYRNFEVILIDDGSTDSSGDICDEYTSKDNRFKVIHKKNEGVSSARNNGLSEVKGDYVFFIDADDFIIKETIYLLYDRAIQSNSDIVIGNYQIIDQENNITQYSLFDKEKLSKRDLTKSSEKFKYFFGKSYGVSVWNKLYKTSFLNDLNIKFDTELDYGEDFLFNVKLYINNPNVEFVNEYTYNYFNQISNSLTNSYKEGLREKYIKLLQNMVQYMDESHYFKANQDIVAYSVFTAIDNISRNSYLYSKESYRNILEEIIKLRKQEIIKKYIAELAKGNYLEDVPRRDWKIFVRMFSILFSFNLLKSAALLQVLRFRLKL